MDSSSRNKSCINFRYEIQYTNQLIDNEHFMPNKTEEHSTLDFQHNNQEIKFREGALNQGEKEMDICKKIFKLKQDTSIKKRNSSDNIIPYVKLDSEGKKLKFQTNNQENVALSAGKSKKIKIKQFWSKLNSTQRQVKQQDESQIKYTLNRKGLALISSLILQVIDSQYKENKQFTCGQISSKVLTEFCNRSQQRLIDNPIEEKQRKTIKRRVYDSINVLIALGKIKKNRKSLYVESIDRKIGEEIVLAKKEKLELRKKQLQKQKQLLAQVQNQYAKLKALKQRNQQMNDSKQQGFSTTFSTHSHKDSQQCYKFPLLLIYTEKHHNMQVTIEQDLPNSSDFDNTPIRKKIVIEGDPLYLLSDLTCLEHLSLKADDGNQMNNQKHHNSTSK